MIRLQRPGSERVHEDPSSSHAARALFAILCASFLLGYGVFRLPSGVSILRFPANPFEHSEAYDAAARFRLLADADRVVPRGVSVCVASATPDPDADTYLHHIAVALLPQRRIIPAALWGVAVTPDPKPRSDYVVLRGKGPPISHGVLVLETRDGSVWRRVP